LTRRFLRLTGYFGVYERKRGLHADHRGGQSVPRSIGSLIRSPSWGRRAGWQRAGQIIDVTVIEARRPRLTQAEKDAIKADCTPADWTPAAARRSTATDAGQRPSPTAATSVNIEVAVVFGYKVPCRFDREHGFLRRSCH
jgi:hypothetical protein